MSDLAHFKATDIKKLAKGLRDAGFNAIEIEIRSDMTIIAKGAVHSDDGAANANGWDQQLAEEEQSAERRH